MWQQSLKAQARVESALGYASGAALGGPFSPVSHMQVVGPEPRAFCQIPLELWAGRGGSGPEGGLLAHCRPTVTWAVEQPQKPGSPLPLPLLPTKQVSRAAGAGAPQPRRATS